MSLDWVGVEGFSMAKRLRCVVLSLMGTILGRSWVMTAGKWRAWGGYSHVSLPFLPIFVTRVRHFSYFGLEPAT